MIKWMTVGGWSNTSSIQPMNNEGLWPAKIVNPYLAGDNIFCEIYLTNNVTKIQVTEIYSI